MKHFGIYSDSSELEQAYQNGDIINPYVALVDGDLDYNGIQPEPCYLGEWSDDGEGHYTFNVLDNSSFNGTLIGHLLGVYFEDNEADMDVQIYYDGYDTYTVEFYNPDGSNIPSNEFTEGTPDNWVCDSVMTEASSSTAQVQVNWNGTDTFEFFQSAQDAPALSMETIDPECSEEGPSE